MTAPMCDLWFFSLHATALYRQYPYPYFSFYAFSSLQTLSVIRKRNMIFWQVVLPFSDTESLWRATEKHPCSVAAMIMPVNRSLRRNVTFVTKQYGCQWQDVTAKLSESHMQTCNKYSSSAAFDKIKSGLSSHTQKNQMTKNMIKARI